MDIDIFLIQTVPYAILAAGAVWLIIWARRNGLPINHPSVKRRALFLVIGVVVGLFAMGPIILFVSRR